jgi:glycosyltransferase 2 family protein
MKKNKKIFQYTSLIVGTILFIFALKYTGMDNILTSLKIVNKKAFFFYLLISISIFFGFVFRWYLIIKCHNYNISLFKLFNYRVAGFAISYLTPSARVGGEPIRTYFLVKNKIPFEKAMSSVVIDKSLELTANAVMTVIGAIIFAFFVVLSNKIKWLIMIIVLISIFGIWLFYSRLFKGKGIFTSIFKILRLTKLTFIKENFYKIREAELEMTRFFLNHKKVFIASTFISFFLWLLSILEFKLLLQAFGFDATNLQVFLVLVAVGLAYLVPIPTALGVLESVQVSLFSIFGKGAQYGIAVSIVTRVRDLMWTFYGLTYIYLKGIVVNNLLKDKEPELNEKIMYLKKWKVK